MGPAAALTSGPRLRLGGATQVGVRPGRPFLHRVAAFDANGRPIDSRSVRVSGLPAGLGFDPSRGVIAGRARGSGAHVVRIAGEGDAAPATLEIVVGDTICLTPPLGWNSWNGYGPTITEADVRRTAEALVDTGLADAGWTQVNIDDGWQGDRDRAGALRPNEKFADLGELCADLHEQGLKVGIYSSPGPLTCGGFVGSLGHELEDARAFAAWGFDYLKHDWCSAGPHDPATPVETLIAPYAVMRQALDRVDRDIVYHLCQYGLGEVWRWARERVGANAWRTTGDIEDTWASVDGIGFGQAELAPFAGPGGWNDPDMLVVGTLGGAWGRPLAPTRLTPDEERSHLGLWALLAAPMLLGCDVATIPAATLGMLTNPELIAIHQDKAGRQARRATVSGSVEAWTKPLADGSTAVGIFNRGDLPADARFGWPALGLGDRPLLGRDVWARMDLEDREAVLGWHGRLEAHASALLVVRR